MNSGIVSVLVLFLSLNIIGAVLYEGWRLTHKWKGNEYSRVGFLKFTAYISYVTMTIALIYVLKRLLE